MIYGHGRRASGGLGQEGRGGVRFPGQIRWLGQGGRARLVQLGWVLACQGASWAVVGEGGLKSSGYH